MFRPGSHFVVLDARPYITPPRRHVGMHIHASVHPGTTPRTTVEQEPVSPPFKPDMSPSPGSKTGSDHDAGAEANCSPHEKARTRRGKHDIGIIVRNVVIAGRDRQNLDIVRPLCLHALILVVT